VAAGGGRSRPNGPAESGGAYVAFAIPRQVAEKASTLNGVTSTRNAIPRAMQFALERLF